MDRKMGEEKENDDGQSFIAARRDPATLYRSQIGKQALWYFTASISCVSPNRCKQRLGWSRSFGGKVARPRRYSQRSTRLSATFFRKSKIMPFGPLGPSLAPAIRANRGLYKWIKPIATWYADLSGHRRLGLKYDDLRAWNLRGYWHLQS